MTYRSLLVLLGQDPLCNARSHVATRMAKEMDCHLVGLAPTGLVDMPVSIEAAASLSDYAALAWDTLRDEAERATARFRDHCHAAGLKSFEAIVDECETATSLVRHAHCSDLCILSQADLSASNHRAVQDVVEEVVLSSARPTLILPCAGRVDSLGRSAMVAWDDSRESARAISDALPLLRLAERVQVIGWNERSDDRRPALPTRLDALHRWLMWQGVSAEVAMESTQIDIADAMLSRAADIGADLIVMGAYGHSRWSERVLGGATRGLLASMTVPVLMSH